MASLCEKNSYFIITILEHIGQSLQRTKIYEIKGESSNTAVYSWDLALSNYNIFPNLEKVLGGRLFLLANKKLLMPWSYKKAQLIALYSWFSPIRISIE